MNSIANNRSQIQLLEKKLNCSVRREKPVDDVIVIDDDEKNIKSNKKTISKYPPILLKPTLKNSSNLMIKPSGASSGNLSMIYKNIPSLNIGQVPLHNNNSCISRYSLKSKQSASFHSKDSTKLGNYLFISADRFEINKKKPITDIILLEESSSNDSSDSSIIFDSFTNSAENVAINTSKNKKMDIIPEQKQDNVISLFQELYRDKIEDVTSKYRPMAQFLFHIGESLALSYPFDDPDIVELITKCAAKCKDEINYDYFLNKNVCSEETICTEEKIAVDSMHIKGNIKNDNLLSDNLLSDNSLNGNNQSSKTSYSLRKRSANLDIKVLDAKKSKFDQCLINKKDNDDSKTDAKKLVTSTSLADIKSKEETMDAPLQNKKLKDCQLIDPYILPLKKCECDFNTHFLTVLFEHLKHGRGYTQASCCLCGFYTPLFSKFVIHMKSEHQITVNNKLYKVTETLQCPFCKYEAYNLPTICRHMKFCNARFMKNIFAPKSDENDIPLVKLAQISTPNQQLNLTSVPPNKIIMPIQVKAVQTVTANEPINCKDTPVINLLSYVICQICQGTVTESLETHMSLVHNKAKESQSKSFLCRRCSPMKVFNSRTEFDSHSLNTHCNVAAKQQELVNVNNDGNSFVNNFLEYKNQIEAAQNLNTYFSAYSNQRLESATPPNKEELKSCIDDFIKTETNSINGDADLIRRNRDEDMHAGKININSMIAGCRCDYCKIKFEDVGRLEYHILRAHHRHFPSHNLLWRLVYHRAIGNCYDACESPINTGHKIHQNCSYCRELYEDNFLLYRHIFHNHSTVHLTHCQWCKDFSATPTEEYKKFSEDQANIRLTERSVKEFTKDSITAKLGSYIDSIRRNVSAQKIFTSTSLSSISDDARTPAFETNLELSLDFDPKNNLEKDSEDIKEDGVENIQLPSVILRELND